MQRRNDAHTNILITGGSGFIGSHLADELLKHGYAVRVLDNLSPRVHGPERKRPDYLDPRVDLIVGDIRDPHAVQDALDGIDAVFHMAASVSMRQSMYEIEKYTSTNNLGTAVLLESLIRQPVERLIVASSSSIYGEGLYTSFDGTEYQDIERTREQLISGDWEARNPRGEVLMPLPTPETKRIMPRSIYALSKFDQEQMSLMIGSAYGISTVALRLFNVFGPRQGFSNPYSGMLAIYASRLLQGKPPQIPEDGLQQRDFVSVHDAVRGLRLALEVPDAAGRIINIGSGRAHSLRTAAEYLALITGRAEIRPEITSASRMGEIRHCLCDISLAREVLGYEPQVSFGDGLLELVAWIEEKMAADRKSVAGRKDLAATGLPI
ncbi:MAG: SDR family NAD(P)-dependent oxidoreductase [Methanomicrobiaceae archaeon]|nr:SDR family NAD(P)-dependent oxidoreductase [Methanomicrobiaceae archaeon]